MNPQENWEEEFDRQCNLYDARLLDEDAFLDAEKVKSFIQSELAHAREEERKRIREKIGKMKNEWSGFDVHRALDEVLSLLNEKE